MAQHFLHSPKSRGTSLASIARMSDEEARAVFAAVLWGDNDGEPICRYCGGCACYRYASRPVFKCKGCGAQFSVTSGTIFADRKMPVRDILLAIAIFVNSAHGHSILEFSREMDVQYRTVFLLARKIREAIHCAQQDIRLCGTVHVDGAFFGGHKKSMNTRWPGQKHRVYWKYNENRMAVVVAAQEDGRTVTCVVKKESEALFHLRKHILPGSIIHTDGALAWDSMRELYRLMKVDHNDHYSFNGVSCNLAESFHSEIRRMQLGVHHHINRGYLHLYAAEMAWRHDHRRLSIADKITSLLSLCLTATDIKIASQSRPQKIVVLDDFRKVA